MPAHYDPSLDGRDDGPGILPHERERVFEPFVQVDGSATRTHGGTGMGLYVVRTLAEALAGRRPDWQPPSLAGLEVVAQPHCHQHAVMGWDVDRSLLAAAGARVTTVGGCCGLAGNFGMERGHYDVSVAVAETALLPAVRANPSAVVLADGFSCRTQLDQLAGRRAHHLAELLAERL